ncbi:MAG: GNAT family N-acetyltransferase [Actinomycetota bacterium]
MTGGSLAPLSSLPASDRIELRMPDERDRDLIRDASTDDLIPKITSVPDEWTPAEGQAFIDRQGQRPVEGSGWSLTIVDRIEDRPVGNLFVFLLNRNLGCADLGYWVGPSCRGRGYAAEAAALAADWIPDEFGTEQVTAYIDPENIGSLRTAERSGFRQIGVNERWEFTGEDLRPMTVWRRGPGGPESELGKLELRMWQDDYRGDSRWFEPHLHDRFVEHGCSGKLWTRQTIIEQDIGAIAVEFPFIDLHVEQIDEVSWIVTYLAVQPERTCRRASLWQRTGDGWRLRFHQGTPV